MRAARRALDRERPDVVVLLNGLFLFESVVWALCRARGIEVVTYERAFVPETLTFARNAPAGAYGFDGRYDRERRPLTPREDAELDRYLTRRGAGRGADQHWTVTPGGWNRGRGRLAVLFTNLTWDTAVINRDLAFPGIHEWLDAAVEHFRDRPVDQLIIRVHPSEVHLPGKESRDSLERYLRRRYPRLPDNVSVVGASDPASSYELMDAADVGLVYTSTTGIELGIRGTPVVVAGETHYRGRGFTIDVDGPEAFHAAVDKALADPATVAADVKAAREYAHFFFFRGPVVAPGVREPVPGLARMHLRSTRELDPGVDERVDRICDEILGVSLS